MKTNKEIEERLDEICKGKEFNEDQLEIIRKGLKQGLDVSIYADPKYDYFQMMVILAGLELDLDVSQYNNPKYNWIIMDKIAKILLKNKEKCNKNIKDIDHIINDYLFCPKCMTVKRINAIINNDSNIDIDYHRLVCSFNEKCPSCRDDMVILDSDITESVINLNKKGYKTEYCCSGHDDRNTNSAYISFNESQHYKFNNILPPEEWCYDNIDDGYIFNHNEVCIRPITKFICNEYYKYKDIQINEVIKRNIRFLNKWIDKLPVLEDRKVTYLEDSNIIYSQVDLSNNKVLCKTCLNHEDINTDILIESNVEYDIQKFRNCFYARCNKCGSMNTTLISKKLIDVINKFHDIGYNCTYNSSKIKDVYIINFENLNLDDNIILPNGWKYGKYKSNKSFIRSINRNKIKDEYELFKSLINWIDTLPNIRRSL